MEERLIVGIIAGDPANIGPEVTVKALSLEEIYHKCRPLVIGDTNVMEAAIRIVGKGGVKIHSVCSVGEALFESGTIDVYDMGLVDTDQLERGKASAMTGEAILRYVGKVIQTALVDEVDGTVTNAFSKEVINLVGYHYSGRAEVYVDTTETERYTMMFAHENMRMVYVSTHASLQETYGRVKKDRVLEAIRIAYQTCRNLDIQQPKIGIAGLSPHSGEDGLFDRREIGKIVPAIRAASGEGIFAEGSVPLDMVFSKARGSWYNMVMVVYHDQGHIPLKVVGLVYNQEQQKWDAVAGVNITLGLFIVRVNMDYRTAFDQASQGVADELSLMNATGYGIRPSRNNRKETVRKQ